MAKKFLASFLHLIPASLPVLDIGAGSGSDALFLAENRFDVVAVDKSVSSINMLKKDAEEAGLKLITEVADLRSYKINGEYGAILCLNVLHYFTKERRAALIEMMKKHTLLGGVHFISGFTKNGSLKQPSLHFLDKDELELLYKDWEVFASATEFKSTLTNDPSGKPCRHEVLFFVARRKQ